MLTEKVSIPVRGEWLGKSSRKRALLGESFSRQIDASFLIVNKVAFFSIRDALVAGKLLLQEQSTHLNEIKNYTKVGILSIFVRCNLLEFQEEIDEGDRTA